MTAKKEQIIEVHYVPDGAFMAKMESFVRQYPDHLPINLVLFQMYIKNLRIEGYEPPAAKIRASKAVLRIQRAIPEITNTEEPYIKYFQTRENRFTDELESKLPILVLTPRGIQWITDEYNRLSARPTKSTTFYRYALSMVLETAMLYNIQTGAERSHQ